MMRKIFGLLLIVMIIGCVGAFDIPKNDGYVTDMVGVLSQKQEKDLEDQIFSFVKETSVQMGILIISSTEGENIAMLATEVGNKRGIGEKNYNNGILILVAIHDRKRFIAVGYGLEGTLPDAIAKRIGELRFPDNFRAGKYYAGLQGAINDIYAYIKKDPTVVHTYQNNDSFFKNIDPELFLFLFVFLAFGIGNFITSPDPKNFQKRKMTQTSWIKFGLIGMLFSGILYFILGTLIGAIVLAYLVVGLFVLFSLFGVGKGGTFFLGGRGGGFGSGSSSFGGFGGGSFGGGGSSGSW